MAANLSKVKDYFQEKFNGNDPEDRMVEAFGLTILHLADQLSDLPGRADIMEVEKAIRDSK